VIDEAIEEQMSKEKCVNTAKNSSWIGVCIFEGMGNPTQIGGLTITSLTTHIKIILISYLFSEFNNRARVHTRARF
jgi:hypothetical protein